MEPLASIDKTISFPFLFKGLNLSIIIGEVSEIVSNMKIIIFIIHSSFKKFFLADKNCK